MILLLFSNLKKSKKTSAAFFLLLMITMLLSYTGSQMTEGFRRLYQEKVTETNSADFAAVLPRSFCEKYREEISGFGQEKTRAVQSEQNTAAITKDESNRNMEIEITDALLLRSMDIQAGNGEAVNGSWTFRNADREESLSSVRIVEKLADQIPENGIYVPYVCRTFFGFALGDTLKISCREWEESFVIAGFTEDVLFGSRTNIAFDLPENAFRHLREQAGADCDAAIVLMKTEGDISGLVNQFSEFVAEKSGGEVFYNTSDVIYAETSRNSNINIYVAIIKAASLIGIVACLIVIGFHLRSTLDKDLKEIGTLKAVGYRGSALVSVYVLQFLVLGALGAIGGIGVSQWIMPAVIKNIATDVGFVWKPVFLGETAGKSILTILGVTGIMTIWLARGILSLKPVEAFQERNKVLRYRKGSLTLEKMQMPFSVNLSVTLKMISYERIRSALSCVIVAVILCVAGFAVILYARLAADQRGLLQVTGAEVYSVNIQAARPEETEEIARELEGGEGVRKVMTAVEPGSGQLLCEDTIYAALGVYSDYTALENPSLYAGRYPKHENETAISGNLAKALGKEIGDTIAVSQIFQEAAQEGDYLIVGLTQGTYTGGLDIALTMEGLRRIDAAAEWQSVHVYLDEDTDVEEYCLRLKQSYADRLSYAEGFEQIFYPQLAPVIDSVAGIVFLIMTAMVLLIMIMGFFVTNLILLTRKTDFGIMKALGYSVGQLISQTVVTFMLYIAGGSILGGIFLYFGSNAVIAGLFRGMGVYRIEFAFPAAWIAALVLCMELVGCLTAFVCAWKIRKIVPCRLIHSGN
ncbi:MAG: ABC transporter permease [Lachnospiraceae bacterium]|nr:ABC transporter permease [Lachnospiraceae bacterium]